MGTGDTPTPLPVPSERPNSLYRPLAGDRGDVRSRGSAGADRFACTLADGGRVTAPEQCRPASPTEGEPMRRRAVFARALALAAAGLLPAGSAPVRATRAASSSDANKALIHRIVAEAFNAGDLDFIDEVLAADYLDHQAGPGAPAGPAAFKSFVRAFRATFPDVQVAVEDLVAEGDRVALRVILRGTQRGALGPIPATGLTVEFAGYHVYRVADGKVAEHWGLQDDLGLLLQLGVIAPDVVPPTPGAVARA
jgi:steroid delta-isomerase-like uncharacterized protein